MSAEGAAYQFLHGSSAGAVLCATQREHALRVRDLVASIGGIERDRVAALLHEVHDHGLDPTAEIGEQLSARTREIADCMPDYLRHDDAEIQARSERLMKSPLAVRILWLCDVIDTFESPVVRLAGLSESEFEEMMIARCKAAQKMIQACADHPRFTTLVVRARNAITELAMKVRVHLVPSPADKPRRDGDVSPGM